jgi:tRNA/tmRNA/rRNA uracil-C5-methylase (TrmA/RlmC/RlmD family)
MNTVTCKVRSPSMALVRRLEKLAVILLALTLASCATDAPAPGTDTVVQCSETLVYQHTYDEVFQACQEAIERVGLSVTDKDSDKGAINVFDGKGKHIFSLHVETINTNPEVSVTFKEYWTRIPQVPRSMDEANCRMCLLNLSHEVPKVLATYH